MASTHVLPQAENWVVSSVPKIGQDHHPPIAKGSTSLSAHAVVKLSTLGKLLDPFALDAKNTKRRLKKATGPTQESLPTKSIARNRWIGKIPPSWPHSVAKIKNVWPMTPKSVRPSK